MRDVSLSPTTPPGALPPAALRLPEAAHHIGMSASWLKHSDVPWVRMGKRARVYLVKDLEAYLAARRSHGAAA